LFYLDDFEVPERTAKPLTGPASLGAVIRKVPFLRGMLAAGIVIVLAFPLLDVGIVYPGYDNLLMTFGEQEAVRVCRHLAATVDGLGELTETTVQDSDLPEEAMRLLKAFHIERLKVYSAAAEVVFSSDPDEVGAINNAAYFRQRVMNNQVISNIVEKKGAALEGRVLKVDVVETYVPIMRQGRFFGAIEVYYDMTERRTILSGHLVQSVVILAGMGGGLFTIFLITLFRAARTYRDHQAAEERLMVSELRLRRMTSAAQDAIVEIDSSGRVAFWNAAAERIFAISREEALGQDALALMIAEDDRARAGAVLAEYQTLASRPPAGETVELSGRRGDGEVFTLELSLAPLPGESGSHLVGILRDISRRKAMEQQLKLGERIVRHALSGIMVTDAELNIQVVNPAFCKVTGFASDEVIGQQPRLLRSGRHGSAFYDEMWRDLRESGEWQGEVWNRRKNGEIYPEWLSISAIHDKAGRVTHYVGIFSDITQQKRLEEDLERLALHDPLTGLANRVLFRERLLQCIREAKRFERKFAVLYLDLDFFKAVNDRHGHDIGDLLLQEVGKRLSYLVREADTVARLGGDEFAIIIESLSDRSSVAVVAEKCVDSLSRPFVLGGIECRIGCSIGVAIYPDDATTDDGLLKQSDDAMYEAKRGGRNRVCFSEPGIT